MTGNHDIGISHAFSRREHGIQSSDCTPIGEEVTLIVMSPRMIAEIVRVVDGGWECELIGWGVGDDTSICESRNWDLTFLQLCP